MRRWIRCCRKTPAVTTSETRAYFEAHAADWDARMPPDLSERLRRFAAPFAADFQAAQRILEIGTGTGVLLPSVRQLAPQAQFFALDLARAMLQVARSRSPQACFIQGDAQALPLPARRFDLIFCHNSFPHFDDPVRALGEIRRALRLGGRLLILHNLPRARVNSIHAQAGAPIQQHQLPPGAALAQVLREAGYTAVQVDDTDEHFVARAQAPA